MKRLNNNDEEAPLLRDEKNEIDESKLASLAAIDEISSKKDILKDDPFSRYLKLLFCFLGLQVSYVLWGVAQEQIMTYNYKPGKFKSSTVRSLLFIISLGHHINLLTIFILSFVYLEIDF